MSKYKCLKCGSYLNTNKKPLCDCGNKIGFELLLTRECKCGKKIPEENYYCSKECFDKYHKG